MERGFIVASLVLQQNPMRRGGSRRCKGRTLCLKGPSVCRLEATRAYLICNTKEPFVNQIHGDVDRDGADIYFAAAAPGRMWLVCSVDLVIDRKVNLWVNGQSTQHDSPTIPSALPSRTPSLFQLRLMRCPSPQRGGSRFRRVDPSRAGATYRAPSSNKGFSKSAWDYLHARREVLRDEDLQGEGRDRVLNPRRQLRFDQAGHPVLRCQCHGRRVQLPQSLAVVRFRRAEGVLPPTPGERDAHHVLWTHGTAQQERRYVIDQERLCGGGKGRGAGGGREPIIERGAHALSVESENRRLVYISDDYRDPRWLCFHNDWVGPMTYVDGGERESGRCAESTLPKR